MRFLVLGFLTVIGIAALGFLATRWGRPSRDAPLPQPSAPPLGAADERAGASLPQATVPGAEGPPPRFTDIAEPAGVTLPHYNAADGRFRLVETMGSGVGLIDYDGDGWLDIYVAQGAQLPYNPDDHRHTARLYRNNGDGTFTDVTEAAGVGFNGYGQGVAVGDFDGDGHDDLFVSGFGRNALYRNNGDGTFTDVTEPAGVVGSGWGSSCAFADFDGDGWLDLYVVHYLADTVDARGHPTVNCDATPGQLGYCPPYAFAPEADVLYRNNGDGTFSDVSRESGIAAEAGNGLGLVIADFDDDGRLDVFVANDQTPNLLFRNRGGMRFEEVALPWGVAFSETGQTRAGMGIAAGDYDGDGRTDLLVTNFYEEPNTLYRNVAPGLFQVTTSQAGLVVPSRAVLGFGADFFDYDNDGHLDLFVTNGHINDVRPIRMPYQMPPQLFRNTGQGRFVEVSDQAGPYFEGAWLGRAAAVGDLTNSGALDVVVTHIDRHPAVLRNDTPDRGRFLSLLLRAEGPSRSPVGARVTVQADGRAITREVVAGASYLAVSDPRVHLGLGTAERIDRLDVRWPSGRSQTWIDLEPDQFLEIVEGQDPRPQAIAPRAHDEG